MRFFSAALLFACLLPPATAQNGPAPCPGVYASDRGKYWVTTEVDGWRTAHAALHTYEQAGVAWVDKVLWSRDLGYIPARLLVSNTGSVVGIDQYGREGYKHALVIWDPNGTCLGDYELENLLTARQIESFVVRAGPSRLWFRTNSRIAFEYDGYRGVYDRLRIELQWGTLITADLRTGKVRCTEPGTSVPGSMRGFSDEARFSIYEARKKVGQVTCKWTPDGGFVAQGRIPDGDSEQAYRLTITPDSDGRWRRAVFALGDSSMVISRDEGFVEFTGWSNTSASTATSAPGNTSRGALKPRAVIFDSDYAPSLRSQMIRCYDRDTGGEQDFTLVGPDLFLAAGTLERLAPAVRRLNGEERNFERYLSYQTVIWADVAGRVYLLEDSDQHTTCVRDGYESLLLDRSEPSTREGDSRPGIRQ